MSAEVLVPIPPFSAGATRDRSRLKFEILAIALAYLAWVFFVAVVAFSRRGKQRKNLDDSKIWPSNHQLKAPKKFTVDDAVVEKGRALSLDDLTILNAVADGYRLGLRESLYSQDETVLSESLHYPGYISNATLRQPSESNPIHRQPDRPRSWDPRMGRSSALSGMTLVHDLHDDGNILPIISDQLLETRPFAQPRGTQVNSRHRGQPITSPIPSFGQRSYQSNPRQVRFSLPSPISLEKSPRHPLSEEVLQQPQSALLPGPLHPLTFEHVGDHGAEISPLHSPHSDNAYSPYNESPYSHPSEFVYLQLPSSLYTASIPMVPVFLSHFGFNGATDNEGLEDYAMVDDDEEMWGAAGSG